MKNPIELGEKSPEQIRQAFVQASDNENMIRKIVDENDHQIIKEVANEMVGEGLANITLLIGIALKDNSLITHSASTINNSGSYDQKAKNLAAKYQIL